jgi:hypothetical protein
VAQQRGAKVKKKLEIDPLHADTIRLIAQPAKAIARHWRFCSEVAEGAGFEPARRFITVYTLSRRAPSTARPPLRQP